VTTRRSLFAVPFVLAVATAAAVRVGAAPAGGQSAKAYPPIEQYLMPRDAEIAMARIAAPPAISDRATVKVLTRTGYEIAKTGDNGAVCLVMRGFSAPTYTPAPFRDIVYDPGIHAPICFAAPAARTALPYYELRTRLAMAGKSPDQIAEGLQLAYVKGELPVREGATFAYMFSAHQHLGPGIGAWRPHVMVFVPYADATTVGATPFGDTLPQVTDDAGTPFAVVVIPVDEKQFVKRPTN
jgi:hypothetical protein